MTASQGSGPAEASSGDQRLVVMVIDDDPVFRAVMEEVLHQNGAGRVILANDGEKAQELLRRNVRDIDAITLDLCMPNLDGVRFLRVAGDLGFAGRLVLVSGEHRCILHSAGKLASMLHLDCAGIFSKPVDFNDVAAAAVAADRARRRGSQAPIDADEVNSGLRNSRLFAYYQPRIDLATGRVLGAEALARMRNADGKLLDAGQMINLAEQNGRITDITWRMIEIVAEDASRLMREIAEPLKLSFNISSSILSNAQFPTQLADIIRLSGMQPENFVLELTESRLPTDASQSLESLTRLRMQGFELAIDDFGTGYSNIEQLRMFPFSELKVDKSFMMTAHGDSFALACVEASTSLARELDLRIVAEGIESERELELARKFGMTEAQGFLFSRPLPFEDFVNYAKSPGIAAASIASVA